MARRPSTQRIDAWTLARRLRRAVGVASAALGVFACRANSASLSKPFPCDPNGDPHSCGTSDTGKPMSCLPGQSFGAQAFCVETCDPLLPGTSAPFACLSPGVLVQTCHPISGARSADGECPSPLQCFATDLVRDHGICLLGCSDPGTCADPLVACDARSAPNTCATNRAGHSMACFPASDLGGQDFCAETCEPGRSTADGSTCVEAQGGWSVVLRNCHPNASASNAAADCPPGLNCLRTNLDPRFDEGLCVATRVCDSKDDCDDPARESCMGDILRHDLYSLTNSLFSIHTDHLPCVHEPQVPTDCPANEINLKATTLQNITDICVPRCDPVSDDPTNSHWPCPPGFTCVTDAGHSIVYKPVCAPAMTGYRCSRNEDCLFGQCIDAGEGFRVCSVSCETDGECELLDALRGPYMRMAPPISAPSNADGQHRYCINAAPFLQYCLIDAECPNGQTCSRYNPMVPSTPRELSGGWVCRARCDGEGRCPARGPMPFSCLPNGECDPGNFGIPCRDSSECFGELTCAAVTDSNTGAPSICTSPCSSDADCSANRFTVGGVCVSNAPGPDGATVASFCRWTGTPP